MADLKVVKEWFKRDVTFANWERDVEVTEDTPERFRFRIYTNNNCYGIGTSQSEGRDPYLGCVASCRTPRAGEHHARGNDLPDGRLNDETWRAILFAIVGYELVKVHHPPSFSSALDIVTGNAPFTSDNPISGGCPTPVVTTSAE